MTPSPSAPDRRARRADLALRLIGAGLATLSYLAITTLLRMNPPPPPADPGAIAYGLAAASFLCASLGSALFLLGHHVFDEVEISPRWGRYRETTTPAREQDAASPRPQSWPPSTLGTGPEQGFWPGAPNMARFAGQGRRRA